MKWIVLLLLSFAFLEKGYSQVHQPLRVFDGATNKEVLEFKIRPLLCRTLEPRPFKQYGRCIYLNWVPKGHYDLVFKMTEGEKEQDSFTRRNVFTHKEGLIVQLPYAFFKNGFNEKKHTIEIEVNEGGRLKPLNGSEFNADKKIASVEQMAKDVKKLAKSSEGLKVRTAANVEDLKRLILGYKGEGEYKIVIQGHIPELRLDVNKEFAVPLIIEGKCLSRRYNGRCTYSRIDKLALYNFKGIQIQHLASMDSKAGRSPKSGKVEEISWNFQNVENLRLFDVEVHGSVDGYELLKKKKSFHGVLNDPKGVFVKNGKGVAIVNSYFHDLFHAVDALYVNNFYVGGSEFGHLASDAIHGGDYKHAVFENNEFHTKMPFKGKVRAPGGHLVTVDIHSDFMQIFTRLTPRKSDYVGPSYNVVIRGNKSFKGLVYSQKLHSQVVGFQCYLIGHEARKLQRVKQELEYRRTGKKLSWAKFIQPYSYLREFYGNSGYIPAHKLIRVYNNSCESNQHHGISFYGVDGGYISNNAIVPVTGIKLKTGVTAAVRILDSENLSVQNNIVPEYEYNHTEGKVLYTNRGGIFKKGNLVASQRELKSEDKKEQTENGQILSLSHSRVMHKKILQQMKTNKGPLYIRKGKYDYEDMVVGPEY